MENLSKMESFESFQVSKQSMNQVMGGRTKEWLEGFDGDCWKMIDNNDGTPRKAKTKPRYEEKC